MTRTLIEKIEALPPEKKAEVEDFVESLESRPTQQPETGPASDQLLERVRARRERLLEEHGLVDSSAILQQLREEGE